MPVGLPFLVEALERGRADPATNLLRTMRQVREPRFLDDLAPGRSGRSTGRPPSRAVPAPDRSTTTASDVALDVDDAALPDVFSSRHQRRLRPNEVADAGVSTDLPFRERLFNAIETVGRSGLFDVDSDSPIETALAAATGTFSTVRGARRQQGERDRALALALEQQEQENARAEQEAALAAMLNLSRVDANTALATLREAQAADLTAGEAGLPPDEAAALTAAAEDLARRWERLGRTDIAQLIRANPVAAMQDASTFLLNVPEDEADEPTDAEQAAIRRADEADRLAGREVLRRSDPGDITSFIPPAARDSVRGELRRSFNPEFAADSTIRARVRGGADRTVEEMLGEGTAVGDTAEVSLRAPIRSSSPLTADQDRRIREFINRSRGDTTGATTPFRTVPPARPDRLRQPGGRTSSGTETTPPGDPQRRPGVAVTNEQLNAIANVLDPEIHPIALALESLRAVTPSLSPEDIREVLLRAGYDERDVRHAVAQVTASRG